ncbi:hypothetical protein OG501_03845 [Streptomyces niveus]|uniref:Integrase n=1 Tax=Streptomyces niveus TaxID=193462 RepID=A0ABZ2A1G6_STRNV|nr:hypothetical protein [Streptomyces niveus]
MSLEKRAEAMKMGTGTVRHGHSRSYLASSGLPSLFTRQELRAKI